MKKDFKKITTISILALILAVFCVVDAILFRYVLVQPEKVEKPIYYHPADYSLNILESGEYRLFDRDIVYSNSSEEKRFHLYDDYEITTDECKFFMDYFQCAIEGRYEDYPSFFVEDYFSAEKKFTMQMIYDIYVSYKYTTETEIDGEMVSVHNFYVRYCIHRNNGTFRMGVWSDAAVPQIYQLIDVDDKYKILDILEIQF